MTDTPASNLLAPAPSNTGRAARGFLRNFGREVRALLALDEELGELAEVTDLIKVAKERLAALGDIGAIEVRVGALGQEVAELEGRKVKALAELNVLSQAADARQAAISELDAREARFAALKGEIAALEGTKAKAKADLQALRERLGTG